jgi:hydrogenase maturation protease
LIVDDRDGIATRCILVIGYGNTLRGDDAVGQHVALAVSNWNVPGLTVAAVHQLTPDLAEPISKVDLAIFVDAKLAGERDLVDVRMLAPSNSPGLSGHTSDPRALLSLASAVFGQHPRAWLATVPAVDFSLREGLSATASRGAADALARIASLIAANDPCPVREKVSGTVSYSEDLCTSPCSSTLPVDWRGAHRKSFRRGLCADNRSSK